MTHALGRPHQDPIRHRLVPHCKKQPKIEEKAVSALLTAFSCYVPRYVESQKKGKGVVTD
jgi:hypothetical protein